MHNPQNPLTARFNPATDHQADTSARSGGPLQLHIDPKAFLHYLDEAEGTQEEREELLRLFWSICCEFVALGFGVHPVQQARNSCGKGADSADETASNAMDVVDFPYHNLIEEYVRGNGHLAAPVEKGVLDA